MIYVSGNGRKIFVIRSIAESGIIARLINAD